MIGWALLSFGLAAFSAVIAIRPRATWLALGSWQFKKREAAELRLGVYVLRSVFAGLNALCFVGMGIWLLATEDERECEQVLAEVEAAAGGVRFETSGPDLADIDARRRLDAVVADRGVELDEHDASIDVVAADGHVLGTIDELGVRSDCD